jgi:hypothetical protein
MLELITKAVGQRIEGARLVVEDRAPELESARRRVAVGCHGGALAYSIGGCEA